MNPDAHEFSYEVWGLCHSRSAAPIGLLPVIGLSDPIEIPRWIRRRRAVVVSGKTPLFRGPVDVGRGANEILGNGLFILRTGKGVNRRARRPQREALVT